MEVKITKEIREYSESMFFGLNLRQCVCSLLALGVAVGLYFGLKPIIGAEVISWLCIVEAGSGLIRCAGNLVPFENSFPKNTKLYQLMTSKPDEVGL